MKKIIATIARWVHLLIRLELVLVQPFLLSMAVILRLLVKVTLPGFLVV